MEFRKLREQVISEININSRLTDKGIYLFVLSIVPDALIADEFLLSEFGGFTSGQLNEIKRSMNRNTHLRFI